MLLTKYVNITIRPLNYHIYVKFYPDIKINKITKIKLEHLSKKSDKKIMCKCEICGKIHKISYRKYLSNKSRQGYYSCFGCKQLKRMITCEKIYNDKNYNNSSKMKKTKQESGIYFGEDQFSPYQQYRKRIYGLTRKNKKILFENWDGYDYYDHEFIKPYLLINSNSKLYPTIDHKISIFYGFKNNMSEKYIANINNLCITKRTLNGRKSSKLNLILE